MSITLISCHKPELSQFCEVGSDSFFFQVLFRDFTKSQSPVCGLRFSNPSSDSIKACELTNEAAIKAENWNAIKNEMESQFLKGSSGTETVSSYGGAVPSYVTESFQTALISSSDEIFFIPYRGTNFIKVNPRTNAVSTLAPYSGVIFYIGGAMTQADIIYLAPHLTNIFYAYNIKNNTVSSIGTQSIAGSAFSGGITSRNGIVYFNPSGELKVWYYNTTTNTFGSINTALSGSYAASVLAPNGKIYMIPFDATEVIKIDPDSQSIQTIGPTIVGTAKYISGVLTPDGKIYMIPYENDTLRYIDTNTDSIVSFGPTLSPTSPGKFNGAVLAPNGKIYLIPYGNLTFASIDTRNGNAYATFGTNPNGAFRGGALTSDGKIYLSPYQVNSFYYIDTKSVGSFCLPIRFASYWNKH
ncbi:hypothetical protein [Leptospira ryugenii]|uniref:hypothetical protein n=1 Tax=Leptospira ryugenii TaxID=1917863 RepID=UPI000D58EAAC|nr:hypothetical protein [Leptospira ryugenii]